MSFCVLSKKRTPPLDIHSFNSHRQRWPLEPKRPIDGFLCHSTFNIRKRVRELYAILKISPIRITKCFASPVMDFHPENLTGTSRSCLSLHVKSVCTSSNECSLQPSIALFNNNKRSREKRFEQETMMINIKINYCSEMCNAKETGNELLWATNSINLWMQEQKQEERWKISLGPAQSTELFASLLLLFAPMLHRGASAWAGKHRTLTQLQHIAWSERMKSVRSLCAWMNWIVLFYSALFWNSLLFFLFMFSNNYYVRMWEMPSGCSLTTQQWKWEER